MLKTVDDLKRIEDEFGPQANPALSDPQSWQACIIMELAGAIDILAEECSRLRGYSAVDEYLCGEDATIADWKAAALAKAEKEAIPHV